MADLRVNFLENYAGGLLNVSRQELSSNGEILSQDGFLTDATIFVEDGVGVKSGLKLGVGLAECVDPTTNLGVVNVRYADRTYTKVRDTKIFTMAIASAQAALSESITESLSVIESVLDNSNSRQDTTDRNIFNLQSELANSISNVNTAILDTQQSIAFVDERLKKLETPNKSPDTNYILGYNSLSTLGSGIKNLCVGSNAAINLRSGNSNTFLGMFAAPNLVEGSNNIFIGERSRGNGSNEIILGNYDHKVIKSQADLFSPVKSKSNPQEFSFEDFTFPIEKFKLLQTKKIYKDTDLYDVNIDYDSLKNNVTTQLLSNIAYHSDPDFFYVSKSKLVPVLISVIQQLIERIEALENI